MIVLPFKRFTVCLHFSFFATVSLLILLENNSYALWALYACIIHETGHIIAMSLVKQRIEKLCFYGAGIKIINCRTTEQKSFAEEAFVLSAGCLSNIAVYIVIFLFFGNNKNILFFGIINLMIGLFNLLPVNAFDGGKLLVLLFYKAFSVDIASEMETYLKKINVFIVLAVIIAFALYGCTNFTLYITLLYLLFTSIFL
jgi:Zn-dependent protease